MNRVDIWDGWRGMAIICLLCGHFVDTPWIWEDRFGVDAFFVLSGMLISTILFDKKMNLKDFYIRRFSRIIPGLALFLLVSFSFAMITGLEFETKEFIANLTFFRTYYPQNPHIWDTDVPVQHLWSLNIEEHAYVIMSLLTLLFFRKNQAGYMLIALGLISIGICFYYYFNEESAPEAYRIRTESSVSFIFLSAGYTLFKHNLSNTIYAFLPGITFIVAIGCYLKIMPDWLSFSLSPLLLAFTIHHLRDAAWIFRGFLELKIIRLMGIWSFSIYLWQQPFYKFNWLMPDFRILFLILSIVVGTMSFYFFEQPMRSWINKRWTGNV